MAKQTKKKSAEIKPAEPAEQIDQTTQVAKVQEVTDEQQSQTSIEPDTVLIDKGIDEPVKEEPVVDKDAEDTHVEIDEVYPNEANGFDERAEKKLADHSLETKEPTRYGHGKEKPADEIEDTGVSRHYDNINPGFITGRKNEYPR